MRFGHKPWTVNKMRTLSRRNTNNHRDGMEFMGHPWAQLSNLRVKCNQNRQIRLKVVSVRRRLSSTQFPSTFFIPYLFYWKRHTCKKEDEMGLSIQLRFITKPTSFGKPSSSTWNSISSIIIRCFSNHLYKIKET